MPDSYRSVLGIDTSGPVLGLALVTTVGIAVSREGRTGLRHTENLLPEIVSFLKETGSKELSDGIPDGIAVVRGPGSFTGLRIGMSTAKALGLAWSRPVVSIDTLHGLAVTEVLEQRNRGLPAAEAVVPVIDARKKRFYVAVFTCNEEGPELLPSLARQTDNLDISSAEMMEMLKRYDSVVMPGSAPAEMHVLTNLKSAAVAGGSGAVGIATLGFSALEKGRKDGPYQGPDYLRDEDIGSRKKGPAFMEERSYPS